MLQRKRALWALPHARENSVVLQQCRGRVRPAVTFRYRLPLLRITSGATPLSCCRGSSCSAHCSASFFVFGPWGWTDDPTSTPWHLTEGTCEVHGHQPHIATSSSHPWRHRRNWRTSMRTSSCWTSCGHHSFTPSRRARHSRANGCPQARWLANGWPCYASHLADATTIVLTWIAKTRCVTKRHESAHPANRICDASRLSGRLATDLFQRWCYGTNLMRLPT